MSRLGLGLALTAILATACGPSLVAYHKTSPRRIEVEKQASAPELRLSAQRVHDSAVRLIAGEFQEVRLRRVVHYGTAIERHESRHNPILELLELGSGLIVVAAGALWISAIRPPDTPSFRVAHFAPLRSLFSPLSSAFSLRIDYQLVSDVEVFSDPPTTRAYGMTLPAAGQTFSYRGFGPARTVLATGDGMTDVFGEAELAGIPEDVVVLEVRMGEATKAIPIERLEAEPAVGADG